MDCDSSGGCDGSSCSHSDCSNHNYHLVDLLSHSVQEYMLYMQLHVFIMLFKQ